MTQDQYPDAKPQHPDGTRIMQPFAFTTGGGGDFRPHVIPADAPEEATVPVPKGESVPEPAPSPPTDSTVDESKKQLPVTPSETTPVAQPASASSESASSAPPAKPAPSLAVAAKQTSSEKTENATS